MGELTAGFWIELWPPARQYPDVDKTMMFLRTMLSVRRMLSEAACKIGRWFVVKFNSFVCSLKQLLKPHLIEGFKPSLELVKIVFDFTVVIVMVWAVFVSRDANQIARQALQRSDTPWLKINGIGVDEKSKVRYVLANYSDSPALRLRINLVIAGLNGQPKTYTQDALMPHDSGNFSFGFDGEGGGELSKQINSGKTPLLFRISYESVQGRNIVVEQEVHWVDDMFRDARYEVKQD